MIDGGWQHGIPDSETFAMKLPGVTVSKNVKVG